MENYRDTDRKVLLMKAYLEGNISPEDMDELKVWLENSEKRRELFNRVRDKKILSDKLDFYRLTDKDEDWKKICRKTGIRSRNLSFRRIVSYAAVFAGLFLMTFAAIKLTSDSKEGLEPVAASDTIRPGGRQAYIELASGEKITLGNSVKPVFRHIDGAILKEEGAGLVMLNDDVLKNDVRRNDYNRIVVPRGGEYQMVLSDGTKVWLNSDSRLEFPVAFKGEERRIRVCGEAYFQVKSDKSRPFHVEVNDMEVVVIGTSFNINAYGDTMKTTLVEGIVDVRVDGENYRLSPGYAANINHGKVIIEKTDVYEQTAWKDGKFIFREKRLEEVMNILSRWYDINVFYQNSAIKDLHFTGNIPRHSTINDVLKFLEHTNLVRFNISGHTVIVSD